MTAAPAATTGPSITDTSSNPMGSDMPSGVAGGTADPGTADDGAAGSGGEPEATGDSPQPTGSEGDYHDPGTGPWEVGTPEQCLMDTSQIRTTSNIAVYRYGLQCFIQGGDTSGSNFSATKTLGGVLAGRAAYLVQDVPRTGPGTGPILHEDRAADWLGSVSYNNEALLSHVMSMTAFNSNLAYGSKSFSYDTLGTREISSIVNVSMNAVGQLSGIPTSSATFMREQVFDKLGMAQSSWSGGTIGTGWVGTLGDMGRMGVMLAHDGWYNGERFMSRHWVYRMSHPAHEDANTSYGQLAWLNHRGNAAGIGGDIASGSNSAEGDPCAPAAFWPSYPHEGSEAPDCRATAAGASCEQTHDVGVFSAQGLGGQFVVVHPGLDLVIVAHNFSNQGGPMGMWEVVRPAVVAMDPTYAGDEAAFCQAYGAGDYAPDLIMPRHPDF
ncbi:MAG: beta-lactamase family protein [Myxococcales bacterium]|nr:beta-lactamase family protein [Myxococcales bacterium]